VPMCDGMTLLYEKINVFGACDLRVSVDGVQQTQLATYDGTLPAFGTEVYQYQWSGTRGPHTFSLAAVANGGFNTLCRFTGAFFHDGDMNSGVTMWNGSHFGYTLANYIAAGTSHTSAIRKGYIKPRLHIIALGTNDTADATFLTNLLAYIDAINAACVTAGEPRPALAILTPPPNGSDSAAAVEEYIRTAAYTAAASRNGEVWEWNELEGDVSTAGGNDPFAQTYDIFGVKDNTHPGGAGHRMIGEYVASKIITNSSPTVGLENLALQMDSGRRNVKVVTASGTAQTVNVSEYKFFNITLTGNCTVTLAGAVVGQRATVEITFKQDATGSRTVTFSPLVKWASGTAFTASTAANAIDKIKLDTDDGGTTWVGTFTKGHA
jgi:lysophospholipase L1-like esterase